MPRSDEFDDLISDTSDRHLVSVEEGARRLGRFVLRYEIASGGMATVYLARSLGPAGFDRPLAIKRIHPHLARKRPFIEMFLDEARVSARIAHPNVCSVYDFGEADGTYFIAMEYLVGKPLSEIVRAVAKRPGLGRSARWHGLAARIVADACEGLHAAHELRGDDGLPLDVVHRDISPQNVFVTYDGAVKVLDFGIARAAGRIHETRTGTVKGKLAYMSPEQIEGDEDLDRRSDVWALGVCLWEMSALRSLFGRRRDVDLLRAVVEDRIAPPSVVRPEVPPALDAIVLRALDRDVSSRYPTARAMGRELYAFAASTGSAGPADLSDLMAELFADDRAEKLGAVASLLEESSSEMRPAPRGRARAVAEDQPTQMLDDLGVGSEAAPPPRPPPPPPPRAPSSSGPAVAIAPGSAPARPPIEAADASPSRPAQIRDAVPAAPRASTTPRAAAVGALVAVLATCAASAAALVVWAGDAAPPPIAATPLATTPTPAPVTTPTPGPATTIAAPSAPPAPSPETATPTAPAETIAAIVAPEPSPDLEPPATPAPSPPEPTPPPGEVRSATGTVDVGVRGGWAEIYLRGRMLARTPHRVRLPAGRHTLELRPFGREPGRRVQVTVEPDRTTRLVLPLD